MKKKGFTLVELLAVIAILAILVIMALPAVLRMYRDARQNTFVEEVQGTYKMIQTQYVQDVTTGGGKSTYTYSNCPSAKKDSDLPITSSSNFVYYATVNGNADVIYFEASNGAFKFTFGGSSNATGITAADMDKSNGTGTGDTSGYYFDASDEDTKTFNICTGKPAAS